MLIGQTYAALAHAHKSNSPPANQNPLHVSPQPGGGGGGGGRLSDEPPEVGTIHKGEVKRIEAYGVFVALPGFRKYGLVHASQVGGDVEQDMWVAVLSRIIMLLT